MRIPLFAHGDNADTSKPLCYKSRTQALALLEAAQVRVLINARGEVWGIQFIPKVDRTLRGQLASYIEKAGVPGAAPEEITIDPARSATSPATITESDMEANIGVWARSEYELQRAREKVAAWPHVGDQRALRVGPSCPGCFLCVSARTKATSFGLSYSHQ